MFTGELRCKAISGGYGGKWGANAGGKGGAGGNYGGYGGGYGSAYAKGYGGGGGYSSSSSDSFRFAVLIAQLYVDVRVKSLPSSVVNVLSRNRPVSLRLPKFKDTRKTKNVPYIHGWTDEAEPRSPIADLFSKLVPQAAILKRKGAFHFPPLPPYPEMPLPANSFDLKIAINDEEASTVQSFSFFKNVDWSRPELSDYGCESRTLECVRTWTIQTLAATVQYRFGSDTLRPQPPRNIEYSEEFDGIIKDNPNRLIIADFTADWCGPSVAVAPIFRFLSLNTPTATFLRVSGR